MTSNLVKEDPHGLDLISKLPNTLLSEIVSQLPTNEAVRTSILSRQWKSLWRLGIDNCLNRDVVKELFHAVMMIDKFNQVWIAIENVKTVELEFLDMREIYLSTMSLGVLVLDTLKCPLKNLIINASKLKVFRAYCNGEVEGPHCFLKDHESVKVAEILEHYSDLLTPQNDQSYHLKDDSSLFENLWTLSIDLDLNNIGEPLMLAIVLRVCTHLKQLELNILNMDSKLKGATSDHGTQNYSLPYSESMLWDKGELCDYIMHSLNVVSINGFNGKERQLEFVRCLITKATVMKRMNICFIDSCSREGADATLELLLLPRCSINVSIVLKPGPEFVSSRNNANFETWISTLK
ncbi:F-box and Leucine Rich Repeat domains containing protein [Theobroma cacao]|uniref:F-box and Leucine Rich Repeat domains containing protein n=1 Tax=Theobroma cacao TaxID=3641 RepID=A0A061F8F0_THECC|nr:F-box and Leucine Rich Repeat domains containing protein [Theobroma cacao]